MLYSKGEGERTEMTSSEEEKITKMEILDFIAKLNETEDALDERYTKELEQKTQAVASMTTEEFQREAAKTGMSFMGYMIYSMKEIIKRRKEDLREMQVGREAIKLLMEQAIVNNDSVKADIYKKALKSYINAVEVSKKTIAQMIDDVESA